MKNTVSRITELFLDFVQTAEYEECSENEDTLKSIEDIKNLLDGVVPDEVLDYAIGREELGFINGFRLAMQLAAECGLMTGKQEY